MNDELVPIEPEPGRSLVVSDTRSVSELVAHVALIHEVAAKVMVKDVDYGVIPGTDKPTLFKPGAEKLLLAFRLAPTYQIEREREGGHLTVYSTCILTHQTTGMMMGSGCGSCSTRESKYAYRQAKRRCPACGTAAVIKGKDDYGGGWLCFVKIGGCGAKWPDGASVIEAQVQGRVDNEDLADHENTVLKMANKRSQVAAVLNVTGASAVYTQDLEDNLPQDEPPPARQPKPAKPPIQPPRPKASAAEKKPPAPAPARAEELPPGRQPGDEPAEPEPLPAGALSIVGGVERFEERKTKKGQSYWVFFVDARGPNILMQFYAFSSTVAGEAFGHVGREAVVWYTDRKTNDGLQYHDLLRMDEII